MPDSALPLRLNPTPGPRDETALRRPGAAGVAIALADGQTWLLARPRMRLVPTVDPAADPADLAELRFGPALRSGFGPAYDQLLDRYVDADTDGVDSANALLALAAYLLLTNYPGLDFDALADLLPFIPGDDANSAMWEAIAAVALGRGPKASPVG